MAARLEADALPILNAGRPEGALDTRARELVRQRANLYERIAPYKRSGSLMRWRSQFITTQHRSMVRELRQDLLRWLPELKQRSKVIVDAVELTTSFEAWDRLRCEQRLSQARTCAAMERMVFVLIGLETDGP